MCSGCFVIFIPFIPRSLWLNLSQVSQRQVNIRLYFQLFNSLTYILSEIYILDTAYGCIPDAIKNWSWIEMDMGGGQ